MLCAALCQDIWVCSEIGLVLQHIGVGLQMKKDCTENFGCSFHKVSDSSRITLDITQSEKQKPACVQQLTLFLRGYDISHGCHLWYQHTDSPAPFRLSLSCQQAAPGTADTVPPPFPTAVEQCYYKSTSRRVIPGLTWTGTACHGKRQQWIYGHLPAKLLCAQPPANTPCNCAPLQATHLQQPRKRGLHRVFKPGLKIFPLFQVKQIFLVCLAAHENAPGATG